MIGQATRTPTGFRSARKVSVLAPAVALGGLVALLMVQPMLAHHPYYAPELRSAYSSWYVVAAAFVPYGIALRAFARGWRPSARVLFGTAVVLYVALIPAPPGQSQDVYQTLLYGKMMVHGFNPYVIRPDTLADPWLAWARWDHTTSVYGPIWTLLAGSIVLVSAERLAVAFLVMKAFTVAMALLAGRGLAAVARDGRPGPGGALRTDDRFAILVFAFNPVVIASVGIGAHADAAVAATLVGAILSERKGHDALTTLLLALAGLVKAYAALVLVAWDICLFRRHGWRTAAGHALGAIALAAVAYLPFADGVRTFTGLAQVGRSASASLTGTIVRIWSGHPTDAFAGASTPAAAVVRVVWPVLLAVAVLAVARSERTRDEPWRAGALLLAAYVLLTPWYLYWHLLGLLVLAAVVSDGAITWGTLTFSLTSLFVGAGSTSGGLLAQALVRYVPPTMVAAMHRIMRARRRSAPPTKGPWSPAPGPRIPETALRGASERHESNRGHRPIGHLAIGGVPFVAHLGIRRGQHGERSVPAEVDDPSVPERPRDPQPLPDELDLEPDRGPAEDDPPALAGLRTSRPVKASVYVPVVNQDPG